MRERERERERVRCRHSKCAYERLCRIEEAIEEGRGKNRLTLEDLDPPTLHFLIFFSQ